LDQNKTPLFDALKKFVDWDPAPFFIPSHKMGEGIDPRFKSFAGENIFKIDLCEVRWLDDFHSTSSSIKEAQELAADAWGAEKSHFLVNGTSGGIIAAICSVCGDGDRIIVPRNAHKSAIYGLTLSGAEPVYVMPAVDQDRGFIGGLEPETLEKALKDHPDAKAVFTVSPSYHGVMCDTGALADIAHRYGAVLISDEAHGNHMYFSDRLPKGALELGADIVCQSTHKMSGALTQASMLHLSKDAALRVDFDKVRANLSMIQTTSPSYILLASLDMARSYIATRGEAVLDGVLDELEKAREKIAELPGIEILGNEIVGNAGVADYEPTRLVISANALGLDGYELFKTLREDHAIECEFADPRWCVCVAGLGTTAAHTEALTAALADVSRKQKAYHRDGYHGDGPFDRPIGYHGDGPFDRPIDNTKEPSPCVANNTKEPSPCVIPPLRMTPREAWFAAKEAVPFEAARGRVSAELVVPYPPGIPILCPGELVTNEVHDFLAEQNEKGRHLHCMAGDSLETLTVVK